MNLLVDTHILIWTLLDDNNKIPKKARKLMEDPDNPVYFSMVSVWEIITKHASHPDQIPYSGKEFYEACLKSDYILLEGKIEHVLALESLHRSDDAPKHKDPFDRLLLAQAKTENLFFITHDAKFSDYDEPCVVIV